MNAPVAEDGWIDLSADDTLLFGSVSNDESMRIHDEAAAGVGELGISAATIHTDDVSEVFAGAGLKKAPNPNGARQTRTSS